LMVSNPQMANPLNSLVREVKELTGKRKRSEADELEIQRLKWKGALYWGEDIGPYVPSVVLWRSIHEAAKVTREGRLIERGLMMTALRMPIQYKGPRDPEAMYKDKKGRFVDIRDANASGRRIMAVRAVFPEWSCATIFELDENQMSVKDFTRLAEFAGERIGIGTYRRMFGRFKPTVTAGAAAAKAAKEAAEALQALAAEAPLAAAE
jgi:hypothetical protein